MLRNTEEEQTTNTHSTMEASQKYLLSENESHTKDNNLYDSTYMTF